MSKAITQEALLKVVQENPKLFVELFPDIAKGLLGETVYKSQNFAGYPQMGNPHFKHGTVANLSNQILGPLNETAFFIDCALDNPIINTTIFPVDSIINVLPVRTSNITNTKSGFITGIDDSLEAGIDPDFPCDPSRTIVEGIEACKINYPYGRVSRQTKTGELDALIMQACRGIYDDLYFVGEAGFSSVRGVSDFRTGTLTMNDRDLIVASALRKALAFLGRNLQKWFMKKIWSGDGTVSTANGGYKEFWGFLNLIRDDYSTSGLPLETNTLDLTTCDALNSAVFDFGNDCLCSGTTSILEYLQEAEAVIYGRAQSMGLLPYTGTIVLPQVHWAELIKCLACEMVADGCATPGKTGVDRVIDLSVVNGTGLEARQRFQALKQITLNGNTYDVFLDNNIPITETSPALPGDPWTYDSSIFFIPFSVKGGELVTWVEHVDYSQISSMFGDTVIDGSGLLGWSDGGKYHHAANIIKRCYEIDTKMEPRLIYKAPHLSFRIDNVRACTMSRRISALVNP